MQLKARCGRPRTHITAKKRSKHRSSCSQYNTKTYLRQVKSYMAELPERTTNTKLSIWSMQKKTLRSLEPFGTMCFGLTKTKLFGHHHAWIKKGEAFVEKNTLLTVKHGGGSIMFWGCVAAGGTGNIVSGRKNGFHQMSRDSRCSMF